MKAEIKSLVLTFGLRGTLKILMQKEIEKLLKPLNL